MPFYTHHNTQIFYHDIGTGNIVVLLHGFGEDSSVFLHQIKALKNNFRCIVPDLPGSGKSNTLELSTTITINDYAHCIDGLIASVSLQKIIILGHSMGGYIALAFAKLFANKIAGFGLLHSTAFEDTVEKIDIRKRAIETINNYGAYSFLKTTIPLLFSQKYQQENLKNIIEIVEKAKQFNNTTLQQYYTAILQRHNSIAVLENATTPVLFIAGYNDTVVPLQQSLQQSYLPQQSHFYILKQSAHMGMLEETQTFNTILLQFCKHCSTL
jgi:pimeloyl-ACP methyl ester carboxylesterase